MTTDPKRARKTRPLSPKQQAHLAARIAKNPAAPATDNQRRALDLNGIPYKPDITRAEAYTLLSTAIPATAGGQVTALKEVGAEVTRQAAELLQAKFNEDWQEFYAALERLRDKPDPDIRAVIYGIDRAMGKVADKHELSGDVTVNLLSKVPRPPDAHD